MNHCINYKNTEVSSNLSDFVNSFKYNFYFVFVYNATLASKRVSVLMNCVSTEVLLLQICKKCNTVYEVREKGFQHVPQGW
jgi:hypothetical protein